MVIIVIMRVMGITVIIVRIVSRMIMGIIGGRSSIVTIGVMVVRVIIGCIGIHINSVGPDGMSCSSNTQPGLLGR